MGHQFVAVTFLLLTNHLNSTGDISALQNMPLTQLKLGGFYGCKITGTSSSWFCLKHRCCPKATHLRSFPECSSFLLTPPTSGDIEVFKDMGIEKLNLSYCNKLTGKWVEISLLKISMLDHVGRVLPQGNTQKNVPGMCFICPRPSLLSTPLHYRRRYQRAGRDTNQET